MNTLWVSLFTSLAVRTPVVIAYIVGIIISLSTWKRNPKPSVLSLIGFLCLLFTTILGSIMNILPYLLQAGYNLTYNGIATIHTVSGVVIAIIDAVAVALIIAAIFSNRKKVETT